MPERDRDIAWTIAREGGATFTNYAWDPGGPTKYGIAGKYHPGVDIEHLTLPAAEAIYVKEYWTPAGCDALPEPLTLNVFDAAVNVGVKRARALLAMPRLVVPAAADDYLWARVAYYVDLVVRHPEKRVSLAGWIERCLLARQESARRAA
jgi:lysozyme family protein